MNKKFCKIIKIDKISLVNKGLNFINNKKAIKYFLDWPEILFFALLIIGFALSLFIGSKVMTYVVITLFGMMGGRLIYERKDKLAFPYYLIIIGFLIGYVIGAPFGDRRLIVALFIFGVSLSYYLHDRGYLRDIPF